MQPSRYRIAMELQLSLNFSAIFMWPNKHVL